jgi:hypothetical protein
MFEIGAGADENRLYYDEGRIYRSVPLREGGGARGTERWKYQLELMYSDEFAELQRRGLVPRHNVAQRTAGEQWFEVEPVRFITRPWEHTRQQNVEILRTICEIQQVLAGYKLQLTDSHLYNFAFDGPRAVLLDVGSIDLLDTAVSTFGINCREYAPEAWSELQPLLEAGDWAGCDRVLAGLECERPYSQRYPEMGQPEIERLSQLLAPLQFSSVVDLGGNCGFVASKLFPGTPTVVVDRDRAMLALGWREARRRGLPHNFAYLNLVEPCAPHGPSVDPLQSDDLPRYHVHAGWMSRLRSDLVFASSISHHLLRGGMSLERLAATLERLAERYICVELIDHRDLHTPGWYGPEVNFTRLLGCLPNWKPAGGFAQPEPTRYWHLLERVQ